MIAIFQRCLGDDMRPGNQSYNSVGVRALRVQQFERIVCYDVNR